ncbi:protein spaetzle 5 [Folsomia candida]|uniref:Protein spaetzle n=1 Tax=Folsomia candida TaxID=158441 RepID=A0A226ENC1_FOLCA|nr:protein spaetzle 5 [Folsomia candida]OXA59153.1 Protein spaetzle [Folsomia candida]
MAISYFSFFLSITIFASISEGGYPPNEGYGGYEVKKYPYLPAPPGETPGCAKGGVTYCEKIDTYPMEVISYLLYKWGRTYQQFISSESNRDYVPVSKAYGSPLPYDSYHPKDTGYLPPPPLGAPINNATGGNNNHKQYVDSYFRKRQPGNGGYDYSYAIPQQGQNHNQNHHNQHTNGGGGYQNGGGYQGGYASTMAAAAAALPPLLHSVWWNHRDPSSGTEAYPHVAQYNQEGWGQRWRRRAKRQAENTLCPTVGQFISPQAAMNMDGNWMYVVNMGNTAQQLVRSEVCARGDGSACNNVCNVAPGLTATCRQKYVQKRLVALDGSGGSLRNDVFWFPHCCNCEIN